jgi:hypothetical protein
MLTRSKPIPTKTAAEIIGQIPTSPELGQVALALATARDRRESLMAELARLAAANARDADVGREREMRDLASALDATQVEIASLRRRRAELRAPLAAAAATELDPLVQRAADQILAGLATIEAGLEQLRQAALETRPFVAGGLNEATLPFSVESLATIDLRGLRALQLFARRLKREIV